VHDLAWYKFYLLDVFALIFGAVFLFFAIIYKVCACICCRGGGGEGAGKGSGGERGGEGGQGGGRAKDIRKKRE
jgi:hypothetical protein